MQKGTKQFFSSFSRSISDIQCVNLEQGVTLQQAHSSGQFVYINGVAAPYDWTHEVTIEPTNSAAAAIHGIANANPFSLASSTATANAKDILEPLYRMIVRHMPVEEIRSTCIIFDNLSALSAVVGEEALISFVQSCRALTETHAEKHNGSASCVVALVHADVDDLLVSSLSHSSDLVLKVDGFKTGFSNEEDGQVCKRAPQSIKKEDFSLRKFFLAIF